MAGFEKVKLATGEPRSDYIQRRLREGADIKQIVSEINAPGLYSGAEGGRWADAVVYAEKRKLASARGKEASKPIVAEAEQQDVAGDLDAATVEVPPEYEDILSAEDVAAVQVEAQQKFKAKQREQARKELLAKAEKDLEREARLAQQRGEARGDMVDVTIDLATYADHIRLDGVVYRHGETRRVTRKVAAVLYEQMQRSYQHQDSLSGKAERPYRRTLAERGVTANAYQKAATGGVRA